MSDKLHVLGIINLLNLNGESDKFSIFRKEVRNHLEDSFLPDSYKKSFLRKFLVGEALQVFPSNSALSFVHIMELLEQRFGNPVDLTEAWIRKLADALKIGLSDSREITNLSNLLNTACKVL